jgi:tetratricopeptide (TPR) repeat protein
VTENRVLHFNQPPADGDTWQVAYIRSPTWVDEGGFPYRPWGALAVSEEHNLIGHSDLVHPGELKIDLMLAAMDSLADVTGTRPAVIEVQDFDLAAQLKTSLNDTTITIERREDLPLIREPMEAMTRKLTEGEPFEAIVKIPGVEIEHVRGFADAAASFHRAQVWEQLESNDIIEVSEPRPEPNVRFACVLGGNGQFGLGFAAERRLLELDETNPDRAFEQLAHDSLWSVTFHEPWEVPIIEHDAWLDHDLATDADGRIPAAVLYGPNRRIRRASPRMLAFFEAVFRTLSETTEDELDSGKWTRVVETSLGPLDLALSLPDLVSSTQSTTNGFRAGGQRRQTPPEYRSQEPPSSPVDNPREEALELALASMDAPGRRGVAMARRALARDPDCAQAHLALARRARGHEVAADRYRTAMRAAAQNLDPNIFLENEGDFWSIPETRPYIQASAGFADRMAASGCLDEAATHYSKILRLNRDDNLGIRARIVPILASLGRDDAADEVLGRFPADDMDASFYNRALMTFRHEGDSGKARDELSAAIRRNPDVVETLLGRKELPEETLSWSHSLSSEDEAALYVGYAEDAWESTPGALSWLAEVDEALR